MPRVPSFGSEQSEAQVCKYDKSFSAGEQESEEGVPAEPGVGEAYQQGHC